MESFSDRWRSSVSTHSGAASAASVGDPLTQFAPAAYTTLMTTLERHAARGWSNVSGEAERSFTSQGGAGRSSPDVRPPGPSVPGLKIRNPRRSQPLLLHRGRQARREASTSLIEYPRETEGPHMTAVWMAAIVALATFGVVTTTVRLAARPLERAALRLAGAGRRRSGDFLTLRLMPLVAGGDRRVHPHSPGVCPIRAARSKAGAPIVAPAAAGAHRRRLDMGRCATSGRRAGSFDVLVAQDRIDAGDILLDAFAVDTPELLVAITGFVRHRTLSLRAYGCASPPSSPPSSPTSAPTRARSTISGTCCAVALAGATGMTSEMMAWSAAVEHDADEHAIRGGVAGVDFASALVNVVRLGQSPLLDSLSQRLSRRRRPAAKGGPALARSCGQRPRPAIDARRSRASARRRRRGRLPAALFRVHEAVEVAIAFMR